MTITIHPDAKLSRSVLASLRSKSLQLQCKKAGCTLTASPDGTPHQVMTEFGQVLRFADIADALAEIRTRAGR